MVMLPCPRCGAEMREVPISKNFLAHWICDDRDSAWHFLGQSLVQGRELRLKIMPINGPRVRGLPRNASISRKEFRLE